MFKSDKRVYIPKIYHELTKPRVLVMSFESGIPLSHVKEMHS
jgi:predicted unusual protein kinase regulating ubiquinone biosynthesis (AarF/ABC1/UbiB family)